MNSCSCAIFFDGFLPPPKRATRLDRLQKISNGLHVLQTTSPKGLSIDEIGDGLNNSSTEGLFSTVNQSGRQGNFTIPFLVSAALDTLRSSRYAAKLRLVPGEADIYCADYVREHGGIVLTNDSDLPVHDLGSDRAVVFLDTIELSTCPSCGDQAVQGGVFNPAKIAERLDISDFKRFAFEIQQDYHITAAEAIRRARSAYGTAKSVAYNSFCKTYKSMAEESQASTYAAATAESLQHLDPRVSEFVLQVMLAHEPPFRSYLPQLLENTEELSAWEACQEIRDFSYSVVLHLSDRPPNTPVWEYRRRHSRVSPHEVEIMSPDRLRSFAENLQEQIYLLKQQEKDVVGSSFWQVLCLDQICTWYQKREQFGAFRGLLEQFPDATNKRVLWPWEVIHLYASILAALASLRQLGQILHYLDTNRMDLATRQIKEHFQLLPELQFLMLDLQSLCELARSFKNTRHFHSTVESFEAAEKLKSRTQPQKRESSKGGKQKSERKKQKGKENSPVAHKIATGKVSVDSNNVYDILRGLG